MVPSDDGTIYKVDTVEHEGHFWIVPEWLEIREEKLIMPARIIQIDSLDHQKTEIYGCQFVVTYSIPKSVLSGETQTAEGVDYVVEERPHIHFDSDEFRKLDPCVLPGS